MIPPLRVIQNLVSLAVDSGTPIEEAKTASLSAVRLISKYGLLGCEPKGRVTTISLTEVLEGLKKAPPSKKTNPKPPQKRAPPPLRDRGSIQELAEELASKIVSILVHKSILGEYPKIPPKAMISEKVSSGVVNPEDRVKLRRMVRALLEKKVASGLLTFEVGAKGGYSLTRVEAQDPLIKNEL